MEKITIKTKEQEIGLQMDSAMLSPIEIYALFDNFFKTNPYNLKIEDCIAIESDNAMVKNVWERFKEK